MQARTNNTLQPEIASVQGRFLSLGIVGGGPTVLGRSSQSPSVIRAYFRRFLRRRILLSPLQETLHRFLKTPTIRIQAGAPPFSAIISITLADAVIRAYFRVPL